MRQVLWILRTFPFTLLGLLLLAQLGLAARGVIPVEDLWRVAIIPAYFAGLLPVLVSVQLFGAVGPPSAWVALLSVPLSLAPLLLADYILARVRRRLRRGEMPSGRYPVTPSGA